MVHTRLQAARNKKPKDLAVAAIRRRIQQRAAVIGMVRVRAKVYEQPDPLKAPGADGGAERDVTVRIRRVDNGGVRGGKLGHPAFIPCLDGLNELLAQCSSAHAVRPFNWCLGQASTSLATCP